MKIWEFINILLAALVTGVFWGQWVALSRSMATLETDVFLAITRRMSRNLDPVMTLLMPAALLSILPVLFLSWHRQPKTFYLTLAGFALFIVALLVTMLVEVPIVKQIITWTPSTLPPNWQQLRDRWMAFHIIRVATSITGLALLLTAAIFYRTTPTTGNHQPFKGCSPVITANKSSPTVRVFAIASASGISEICVPFSTTSRPNFPACTRSIAAIPYLVASIRS